MSIAPPIMSPAMLNVIDRPPLDRKPWLPPLSAPLPSHSKRLPSLWLPSPITPGALSPVSPFGAPSSALFPPPSNSNTTNSTPPPVPIMSLGPSSLSHSSMPTLPYPVVRSVAQSSPPSYFYEPLPPTPPAHRYHPYPLPSGKYVCGPPSKMTPPHPPHTHSHAPSRTLHPPQINWTITPTGQVIPVYSQAWPGGFPGSVPAPTPGHVRSPACTNPNINPNIMYFPPYGPGPLHHGLPTPPASATLPPAAVLPRHPELVAHAALAASLEAKRKRIVQWAIDVTRSGPNSPEQAELELELELQIEHDHQRRVRRRTGATEYVYVPNPEDEAAEEAASRKRRID